MFEPLEIPDIDLNFNHRIENKQLREQLNVSEAKNKNLTNFLAGVGICLLLSYCIVKVRATNKRNKESKAHTVTSSF